MRTPGYTRVHSQPWLHTLLVAVIAACVLFSSPLLPLSVGSPLPSGLSGVDFTADQLVELREGVRGMFTHAYDSYLRYAFPHDELKPLSKSWSDSLSELGNSRRVYPEYHGVALTMIDSLSTLAVMRNSSEFARAVDWIVDNIDFDLDVRVNLFEANIRILGGLLSAHMLALDQSLGLHPTYGGGLLPLAKDLGDRFMPAFVNVRPYDDDDEEVMEETIRGRKRPRIQLPYAWINLRHGVEPGETSDQCAAGIGTLLIEFGLLSHLTNDTRYYDVAERSLFSLWRQRSQRTNLVGNSLSCLTGEWTNPNSGVGAGVDSYFEYLLKSHIFFGNAKFLHMWELSYAAIQKFLKYDRDWLVEGDMHTGSHTHIQFNSLTGFWPGLQSLVGDFSSATATHAKHFSLWTRFDGVPERFLLQAQTVHSTERHYILRPELMESTYLLYRSTRNPVYLEQGRRMYESLQRYARVDGGYASFRDLERKQLEDRMNSFFLAETVKYLYLLFDSDNWVHATSERERDDGRPNNRTLTSGNANWLFNTEGHIFPILPGVQRQFGDLAATSGRFESTSSYSDGDVPSMLSPAHSKSRYSLFTAPVGKMNTDTRGFYRRWKEQEGVDFRRLARSAKCPRLPAALMPDPMLRRQQSEFYRLAAAVARREQVANRCFPSSSASAPSGAVRASPSPATASSLPAHAQGDFVVHVGDGSFSVRHLPSGERVDVRNLGTSIVEITNLFALSPKEGTHTRDRHVLLRPITFDREGHSHAFKVTGSVMSAGDDDDESDASASHLRRLHRLCAREWDALGAFFGPPPTPTNATDDQPNTTRFSNDRTSEYLVGTLVVGEPFDGCSAPVDAAAYRDRVVLLTRGACTFVDKVHLAQSLGAIGVIIANNEDNTDDDPQVMMMGSDHSQRDITIPSLILPKRDGDQLRRCVTRANEHARSAPSGEQQSHARTTFSVELSRYQLAPAATAVSAAPSSLHPRVTGDLAHMFITAIGGWTIEIEEKRQTFTLKVY